MTAVSFAQSLVAKSKPQERKKYSKIDYKDACGVEVGISELAETYGVSTKTIERAFSEFNGDHLEANYTLIERNLVPDCNLEPGTYMRKIYRDQKGNRVTKKECARIMGLDPHQVRVLYWTHKSDYRYIYANYGKTKIKNLAKRKSALLHCNLIK